MGEHQKVDWSALHTVEEMRQLSNFGHWIEGGLCSAIQLAAGTIAHWCLILVHEQHGTGNAVEWAQRIHRYLGILLILASIAFAVDNILAHHYRWLAMAWPMLITLCGLFLMLYREPPGSFEDRNNGNSHHEGIKSHV